MQSLVRWAWPWLAFNVKSFTKLAEDLFEEMDQVICILHVDALTRFVKHHSYHFHQE